MTKRAVVAVEKLPCSLPIFHQEFTAVRSLPLGGHTGVQKEGVIIISEFIFLLIAH